MKTTIREASLAIAKATQQFQHFRVSMDEAEAAFARFAATGVPQIIPIIPDLRDQMREAIARYHAEQVQEAEDA